MDFDELFARVQRAHPSAYLDFHKKRFRKLHAKILALPHTHLLDVGETGFTEILRLSGMHVTVLDLPDCNLENDPIPFPADTFDLIIYTEVMEHLKSNYDGALRELHRVLQPRGHIIVGTPNVKSLRKLLHIAKPEPSHSKEFTKDECERYVSGASFTLLSSRYERYLDYTIKTVPHYLYSLITALVPPWRESIYILARK